MNNRIDPNLWSSWAVEVFEPNPDVLYNLDTTAHLAGLPRRSILIYCRAGLLRPVFQPPYGVMGFPEQAIYTLRKIERIRNAHGAGADWIKVLFELHAEIERLQDELRYLRDR